MADPLARDRSMATNIAWILDQNHKAKVVLWAHDGHVAAGGVNHETMGTNLRARYGAQMVVVGFAFNQGSFRAVEVGVGKIRDFTVPPAPADSLDGALAAARLPLFALDLRKAPPWFLQERKSRQIGAGFSEGNADAYLMAIRPAAAFDALLFVDTTTASRKAPPPAPSATPSPSPVRRQGGSGLHRWFMRHYPARPEAARELAFWSSTRPAGSSEAGARPDGGRISSCAWESPAAWPPHPPSTSSASHSRPDHGPRAVPRSRPERDEPTDEAAQERISPLGRAPRGEPSAWTFLPAPAARGQRDSSPW